MIRRAAGLGRAPTAPDADRYTQVYAHCDVLVVGAGPSGLAAALAAAASGASVILCDEQAEMGGSLLAEREATIDGQLTADWLRQRIAELTALPTWYCCPARPHLAGTRTISSGCASASRIIWAHRIRSCRANVCGRCRAKEVVLATGAIERPIVFPDNDRPGVMMAEAARTYVNRYGARPGARRLSSPPAIAPIAPRSISRPRASRSRPSRTCGMRQRTMGRSCPRRGHSGAAFNLVTGTGGRFRVSSATLRQMAR